MNDAVQEQLIEDCGRVRDEKIVQGTATAILIAGDIAYAGKEAEYDRAGLWIDRVAKAAGCNPRSVRLIPGNHDVDWNKLGPSGRSLVGELRRAPHSSCGDLLQAALLEKSCPLVSPLEDYFSFAAAYGCSFDDFRKPFHEITYPLGDRRITIRGLCSAFVSDRSDALGSMVLSTPTYTMLAHERSESELIVMVHHPLEWFKNRQHAASFINSRSKLLLTGHEHFSELVLKAWSGEVQQLHIAAGAVNPPEETSLHHFSYNWIELYSRRIDGGAALRVRVIPRIWNNKTAKFDTDYSQTGKAADWTIELPLPAAKPHAKDDEQRLEPFKSTPTAPTDFKDDDSLTRFRFWRFQDRKRRQDILQKLGALPAPLDGAVVPFYLENLAFENALKTSETELNVALGPPSDNPIVSYPKSNPSAIEREMGLHSGATKPSYLDAHALEVLSEDFRRAGYLRTNQTITAAIRESKQEGRQIILVFSADLIPIEGPATVFAPKAEAPKNTQLLDYEYLLGKKRFDKTARGTPETIHGKVKDRLTIKYGILNGAEVGICDDHVWPSPVTDYIIRFKRKARYRFEVFKGPMPIEKEPLLRKLTDKYEEFTGMAVSVMAQRIWWRLTSAH